MMKSMLKKMNSMIQYPSPSNINMWWNMGSILMMCMTMQTISGIILSMSYCPNIEMAFSSTVNMNNNLNMGWMIRFTHINTASLIFLFMYIHIARGMYFSSFNKKSTWLAGVIITFMMMMTAFMGYVLPWGQMSFWGATVITNLLSAIPYIGPMSVEWVWGGFSINNFTLNRFFTIHFMAPLAVWMLIGIHILTLHTSGSSNPLGINSHLYMIPIHPYFSLKDYVGFILVLMTLMVVSSQSPTMLMDPDNFSPANPMMTPPHIKPEWYFLFAYSILRSIPSKLGGVMCLMMSILILMVPPLLKTPKMDSMKFYPMTQVLFWVYINSFLMLTWTGGQPIEFPFMQISQLFSIVYFSSYLTMPAASIMWDNMMNNNHQ